MSILLEDHIPVVRHNGVNTGKDVELTGSTILSGQVTTGTVAKKVTLYGTTSTTTDLQAGVATIAELLGGIIRHNSKTGASTFTTPTGAELSAGITGVAVGYTFDVLYVNYGNQTSTITAGASGVTIVGTAAVTTAKNALLRFVNTAANTWLVYTVWG